MVSKREARFPRGFIISLSNPQTVLQRTKATKSPFLYNLHKNYNPTRSQPTQKSKEPFRTPLAPTIYSEFAYIRFSQCTSRYKTPNECQKFRLLQCHLHSLLSRQVQQSQIQIGNHNMFEYDQTSRRSSARHLRFDRRSQRRC